MASACPIRILFVEDLPSDAELAELELRRQGVSFISLRVETKEAFLAALQDFRPDVVISDYALPAFDGMQALLLTLQHDPFLPVILATGSMNEDTAVACMKAGATDYVIKEHITRLPFAIKEALAMKQTRMDHAQAEAARRKREVELQCILGSTADGILAIDKQGKMIQANRQFAEMWRIPQSLVDAGDNQVLLDYVVGQLADPVAFLEKAQSLYKSDQESMDTLVFKDGRNFERYGLPMLMDGVVTGRVWSFRDVTKRRQATEVLRRQAMVLNQARDTITITDLEGIITDVNAAQCQALGRTREELIGKSVEIYGSDPARGATQREFIETTRTRGEWRGEVVNVTAAGKEVIVECRTWLLRDDQGKAIGLCGVGTDITERKRAEAARRESEERLRSHTDNSPLAVVEWSADLMITRWTGAAEKMFGWSAEEAIGKPITELPGIYEEDIPAAQRVIQQLADGVAKHVFSSNRNLTKNGQVIHCEWYNSVLRDAAGKMISVLSQVLDITERKRAEEQIKSQLEELQRWQDVMLGREDRVQELKREVNQLCRRIGDTARYPSQEAGSDGSEAAKPKS
jgi:PAS domain S-box-containing protein